jgi:NADH-quinone oxidoreductase subunit G
MPVIEINGKKIEAEAGAMIIEVTDNTQIQVPRFCYHKKLSIAANCRMCLVEVEKAPKPLPACATPVTEGMRIWTHSPKALQAQKSVLEFLLINHPLDCPICDQGGECELQDLSMGYGKDASRFHEGKRVVQDKNLGPLIATDMTRCIHCTRCVRFGSEIAGVREIGATGRGECTEIGTFIERAVQSEVSGNIIDLCPVGALTSKPFRFSARGWELKQTPGISPHDCVGSNLFVHTRRETVMRVVPRENEDINESWLSDRDRFSYEALQHETRLTEPKIKKNNEWISVSWAEALKFCVDALTNILQTDGAQSIGALVSPNSTIEEYYLLQKLMRQMGSPHIDHRLRQLDFRLQEIMLSFPSLGVRLKEIESQSVIVLVGSYLRKEQPIIALKLRRMVANGGKVCVINPADFSFNFDLAHHVVVKGDALVLAVAKIAKALLRATKKTAMDTDPRVTALSNIEPSTEDFAIAELLLQGKSSLIWLGALATTHPSYSQLMAVTALIAEISSVKIGILTEGANQTGAYLAGCVPHRLPGGAASQTTGLSTQEMLKNPLKAYLLWNIEPDLDCSNGKKAIDALAQAKCVIAVTSFTSETLSEIATVQLPLAPFSETEGTFVNGEGSWQSFKETLVPKGDSRPGWKIARMLGNLLKLDGFSSDTVVEILAVLKNEILNIQAEEGVWSEKTFPPLLHKNLDDIILLAPIPLYAIDSLVRRASSLQKTQDAGEAIFYLNTRLVERLKLSGKRLKVIAKEVSVTLPFTIDDNLPDNTVLVWGGLKETIALGEPYQVVQLENVQVSDD